MIICDFPIPRAFPIVMPMPTSDVGPDFVPVRDSIMPGGFFPGLLHFTPDDISDVIPHILDGYIAFFRLRLSVARKA